MIKIYVLLQDEGYDGQWNVWGGVDLEEGIKLFEERSKKMKEEDNYYNYRLECWDGFVKEIIRE